MQQSRKTNHHHHDSSNIRKWVHRCNEKEIDGIISKIHGHKPIKITDDIEKKDCKLLAGYISKELNLVIDKPC
jgi:hypothetical protein